jgi:mRNA-decapping enzyme 1B
MASIVISEEAKRAANLRVLQRADSDIVDILESATHVVLYEFNATSKAWEKRNVEGS